MAIAVIITAASGTTTRAHAKTHDAVVKAVFNGAAGAGGFREDDLEKLKGSLDLTQIRIVAYANYYPNRPLFAAPTLRKEFAEKLRTALLELKPGSTRHIPENGQYAIKERMQSRHDEQQQGYAEYAGSAHFAARDLL